MFVLSTCIGLIQKSDYIYNFYVLRWLVTVSSTYHDLEFDGSL